MRSPKWITHRLTVATVSALTVGVLFQGPVYAGQDKLTVCHFQPGQGTWKVITVGSPAARNRHLENHDDALPGGTTSGTDTPLDEECVEVAAATCPCDFSEKGVFETLPVLPGTCSIVDEGQSILIADSGPPAGEISGSEALCCAEDGPTCLRDANGVRLEIFFPLSEEELQACKFDLLTSATALGIPCN